MCHFASFEFASILLRLRSSNRIWLISVYRKQEVHYSIFQSEWIEFMDKMMLKGDSMLIIGDLNLWVDDDKDKEASQFLALMSSYGLNQVVKEPTHRCGHTLDQIYYNEFQLHLSHEVVRDVSGVSSDHSPLVIQIPLINTVDMTKQFFYRNIKGIDSEGFQEDIAEMWTTFDKDSSFSDMIKQYMSKGKSLMDKHAPMKLRKLKRSGPEWMDSEYRKSRSLRRKLEKIWKAQRSDSSRTNYIKQKQVCCALSVEKQKLYYSKLIDKASSQKDLFKVANDLLDKRKVKILPPFSDPKLLADEFNSFFIEKVKRIRLSIPVENEGKSIYCRPFIGTKLISFRQVTQEEIHDLIKEYGIKT